MDKIEALVDLIQLEMIEDNIFRGESYRTSWKRVFGGQVIAQALHAANCTVPDDRYAHSMHGYFILPGDIERPIVYEVDRIRDGGSFTTRRVVAIQNGRPIFNMSASFQLRQEGYEHQFPMPDVPGPETLLSNREIGLRYKDSLPALYHMLRIPRPIEFRPVEVVDYLNPEKQKPCRHIWMRAKEKLNNNIRLHQEILTYASDYNLLTTTVLPHIDEVRLDQLQLASLDHAIWFHHEFRMDEWLLYALDSPSASNARGFTRGNIFNKAGKLVASVVQEGMVRKRRKKRAEK